MVDDSINEDRAVEAYYAPMDADESREHSIKAFVKAAQDGNMDAPAPFNYGHKGATVKDMMEFALNDKGGVTLGSLFKLLGELSKGDDEAMAMLEAMADQFIWRAL